MYFRYKTSVRTYSISLKHPKNIHYIDRIWRSKALPDLSGAGCQELHCFPEVIAKK